MEGRERLADGGGRPTPRGEVRGVDPVAGEEVDDDRGRVADAGLAEELRGAEGEQAAHARGQRAQRTGLGGELRDALGVGGRAHHDAASVVEVGHGRVVATGRPLGQDGHPDHPRTGQSRGHGRG